MSADVLGTAPAAVVAELAAPDQQSAPEKPPAKPSKAERRAALAAAWRGDAEPAAEPKPADAAPSADPAAEPEKPAPEKPKEAPKPADTDAESDLKQARTIRQLKDAKADLLEAKPQLEEYAQLKEKIGKAKEDPSAALGLLKDLLGRDYGEFTEWLVENKDKIQQQQKYAELPPDVREKMEKFDRDLEERTSKEAARVKAEAEQKTFVEYSDKISSFLDTHEDDYPLCAADSKTWAADVATELMQTKSRDVQKVLRAREDMLKTNLSAMLGNEKLRKALFASVPELRTKMAGDFASAAPQPNKSPVVASLPNDKPSAQNGPSTLTNRSTASDASATLPARASREERKRQIQEAIRRGGGL